MPAAQERLRFDIALSNDPHAPSGVRRFLEEVGADLPEPVLEDLKLACTELVTNSIRHSGMGPEGKVSLRLEIQEDRVRIEVRDPGTGFTLPPAPMLEATTGRGLLVVQSLSTVWGVDTSDGTCVWFELALPA